MFLSAATAAPTMAKQNVARAASSALPFNFTYLFTASLDLGKPSNYITVEGGKLVNEPVAKGTVEGPGLNGTIQGGFAHPSVYNGTLQVPTIDLYGITNDGESFYIHETGIGEVSAQVTRIVSIVSENSMHCH